MGHFQSPLDRFFYQLLGDIHLQDFLDNAIEPAIAHHTVAAQGGIEYEGKVPALPGITSMFDCLLHTHFALWMNGVTSMSMELVSVTM